ncbi:MAG: hypothetical protein DRQ63_09445 [Gammaproteobacteria bacterium]|nr:MAG: hypothetical protein DRQ63_09445 [Gammaproteobacteria bacterium]
MLDDDTGDNIGDLSSVINNPSAEGFLATVNTALQLAQVPFVAELSQLQCFAANDCSRKDLTISLRNLSQSSSKGSFPSGRSRSVIMSHKDS